MAFTHLRMSLADASSVLMKMAAISYMPLLGGKATRHPGKLDTDNGINKYNWSDGMKIMFVVTDDELDTDNN